MRSFEVCYSFVGFLYVYYLILQSIVVFCLVFLHKSAAQFFSNVHVSFVFCGRSAVQFVFLLHLSILVTFSIFVFRHVQFFVFANFVNAIQVYLIVRVHLFPFVFIGCVFVL